MSHRIIVPLFACIAACAAPAEQGEQFGETAVMAASLQKTTDDKVKGEDVKQSPPEPKSEKPAPEQPAYRKTAEGVTGLPGANGLTFQTLDAYLAHLEKGGHVDRPFWEKMEDGRYRWNTGRGMQFNQPKYATREELLSRYGFDE